jgi:hypothetical protein
MPRQLAEEVLLPPLKICLINAILQASHFSSVQYVLNISKNADLALN